MRRSLSTSDILAINSYHKFIFITIRTKLACKKPDTTEAPTRYYKPAAEQENTYNFCTRRLTQNIDWEHTPNPLKKLGEAIKEAVEHSLDTIPKEQKRDYISKEAWNMMTSRETAIENGQHWEADQLNKQINKT